DGEGRGTAAGLCDRRQGDERARRRRPDRKAGRRIGAADPADRHRPRRRADLVVGAAVAAVVLAAGGATRFGSPKQRRFLPSVLDALRAAPSIGEIVVVAGAYDLEAADARVVLCEDWAVGPGASLRCGLRKLDARVEATVVV